MPLVRVGSAFLPHVVVCSFREVETANGYFGSFAADFNSMKELELMASRFKKVFDGLVLPI